MVLSPLRPTLSVTLRVTVTTADLRPAMGGASRGAARTERLAVLLTDGVVRSSRRCEHRPCRIGPAIPTNVFTKCRHPCLHDAAHDSATTGRRCTRGVCVVAVSHVGHMCHRIIVGDAGCRPVATRWPCDELSVLCVAGSRPHRRPPCRELAIGPGCHTRGSTDIRSAHADRSTRPFPTHRHLGS